MWKVGYAEVEMMFVDFIKGVVENATLKVEADVPKTSSVVQIFALRLHWWYDNQVIPQVNVFLEFTDLCNSVLWRAISSCILDLVPLLHPSPPIPWIKWTLEEDCMEVVVTFFAWLCFLILCISLTISFHSALSVSGSLKSRDKRPYAFPSVPDFFPFNFWY